MMPLIRQVAIFLLLGAMVNVAVAWAYSLFVTLERRNQLAIEFREQESDVLLVGRQDRRIGGLRLEVARFEIPKSAVQIEPRISDSDSQFLMMWGFLADLPASSQSNPIIRVVEARGWPMLAMWGGIHATDYFDNGGPRITTVWSVALRGDTLLIPLRPHWPGFAINMVFYAAILWLLFTAPIALRRRRRIKRGLCPACAYPIGASDKCTECGAAVNRIASP